MVNNFDQPEFLLAEIPVKDNSSQDDGLWIYCTRHLSLIQAVFLDDIKMYSFNRDLNQKQYTYRNIDGEDEEWLLIFSQNNVRNLSEDDPEKVLDNAYAFLAAYFRWEDENIDQNEKSSYN